MFEIQTYTWAKKLIQYEKRDPHPPLKIIIHTTLSLQTEKKYYHKKDRPK